MEIQVDQSSISDEVLVHMVFEAILARSPQPAELRYGVGAVAGRSDGFRRYLTELVTTAEAAERRSRGASAPLFVYPGHYYSPICDIAQLKEDKFVDSADYREILGINFRLAEQQDLFITLSKHFHGIHFSKFSTEGSRYYYENDFYNIGDATILAAFIRSFKPKRIVEVGSGFSSAVILDTLDAMEAETGSSERIQCTFIEPHSERLRGLLKDTDLNSINIIEEIVQNVDKIIFESLVRNDILFLETTHISKTGSDVNYEIFEILPRLSSGVIIHFHDFFHNFKYPNNWILDENRSWNEIYILRALLMHNTEYEIIFFNNHFATECAEVAEKHHSAFAASPGGGLWLRRR